MAILRVAENVTVPWATQANLMKSQGFECRQIVAFSGPLTLPQPCDSRYTGGSQPMDITMNDRLLRNASGARSLLSLALGLGLAASVGCGGDDDDGADGGGVGGLPELGFAYPTEVTTAYVETETGWDLVGDANWDCLGTAADEVPSTTDITLTGALLDFQTDEPLPGGEITLYGDDGITGSSLGTATSDEDGNFEITLPTGQTTWAFKMVVEEALDTYSLNQYFEPAQAAQSLNIDSVSLLTAQALPAFIGVTRTPGLGIIAGSIRDCDGNVVKGTIAAVSETTTTPTHVEGGVSYYFSAANTSLPVRHSLQNNTNTDGVFVTIELPPGQERYLQVWGFVDAADLADGEPTLLAEIPAPIIADSVVTVRMRPLRQ